MTAVNPDSNLDVEYTNPVEIVMSPSQKNWPFVINVGNSIIGVTVLAMPYCFQQCGILLGSLLLFFSMWLTTESCQLLMKAGLTSRRRSFELLAYYTYGAAGKLLVELGMVLLQVGTMVAQVVVVGDLGSAIIAKATGIQNSGHLRAGVIILLCLCVGLPLALHKDVRALAKASTMCIMFYTLFCVYVVLLSIPNLISGTWYSRVNFWRQEGFFKCFPIFSFAFGCQTQLFIVYDALADPSLKRINNIVSSAVHMCTACYLLVAFFGYITFFTVTDLSGDMLNHLQENLLSDALKLSFVLSIAVSMPLIIFPCRVSLHTLLFPPKPKEDVPHSSKMPESHFLGITVFIVVVSMIIAILIPNIEFVLALTGATAGTLICYIFPALFFLNVMSENTEKKMTARVVLVIGLSILLICTYTTLSPPSPSSAVPNLHGDYVVKEEVTLKDLGLDRQLDIDVKGNAVFNKVQPAGGKEPVGLKDRPGGGKQQPPIPQEPDEKQVPITKNKDKLHGKEETIKADQQDLAIKDKKEETKIKEMEGTGKKQDIGNNKDAKTERKDDEKKFEAEKMNLEEEAKKQAVEKKQEQILEKLEHQQEEQKKLIAEQREILEQLKQHNEKHKVEDLWNNQQEGDGIQNQEVHQGQQLANVGQKQPADQINMHKEENVQVFNADPNLQAQKFGLEQQVNVAHGQQVNESKGIKGQLDAGQFGEGYQYNEGLIDKLRNFGHVDKQQQLNLGQGDVNQNLNAGQVGQQNPDEISQIHHMNAGKVVHGQHINPGYVSQGLQLIPGQVGQGQQVNAGQDGKGHQLTDDHNKLVNAGLLGQDAQAQPQFKDQRGQDIQLDMEHIGKGQQKMHEGNDKVDNQKNENLSEHKENAIIGRDLLSGKDRQEEYIIQAINENVEAQDTLKNREKREAELSNGDTLLTGRQNSDDDLNADHNLKNNEDIKDELTLTETEKINIVNNKDKNYINSKTVIDKLNVDIVENTNKGAGVLEHGPLPVQLNFKKTENLDNLMEGLKEKLGESFNFRKGTFEMEGLLVSEKKR
ncbi:putative sodium-coupled neutral amino acid transporter 10 isoform X1 [Dreissena polymorpha]|nr:putative sodium-coupled neutral amino acid transporter 10 isoform X1 [Dreissena polymorpha]